MQYLKDILDFQMACVASQAPYVASPLDQFYALLLFRVERTVQGIPPGTTSIDPDSPPENFKEAMANPDQEQGAKEYQKESGIQGQKCACRGESSRRSEIPWNDHAIGV